jgi:hypothetical protein
MPQRCYIRHLVRIYAIPFFDVVFLVETNLPNPLVPGMSGFFITLNLHKEQMMKQVASLQYDVIFKKAFSKPKIFGSFAFGGIDKSL